MTPAVSVTVTGKRRGRTNPGSAYVVMAGSTFAYLLREAGY